MNILQVNTCDLEGGAAKVAWNLFQGYRGLGHDAWLAVGKKLSSDRKVLALNDQRIRNSFRLLRRSAAPVFADPSSRSKLSGLFFSHTGRYTGRLRRKGREAFDFPVSWHLLDLFPILPNIIHFHNLHGSYFDLRALPWLSKQAPVVLTLHDAWALSGHCAHSFQCRRWETGCGSCPDLKMPVTVESDATAQNWSFKKRIFRQSSYYVATPCRWLMGKVQGSMVAKGAQKFKVIPNGVDLTTFCPGNKEKARKTLNIPQDAFMLLSMTKGYRNNPWQDYSAMETAVVQVADKLRDRSIWMVSVGSKGDSETKGRVHVVSFPYETKSEKLAMIYQAADLFVHPAKADTFPTAVLESLACGTPVVATSVGGIPEQINGLKTGMPGLDGHWGNTFGKDATGILAPPGDKQGLYTAIEYLLAHDSVRRRLGAWAIQDARNRFDLIRQIKDYLRWYTDILEGEDRFALPPVK